MSIKEWSIKRKLTNLYQKRDMETFTLLLEKLPPKKAGKIFVGWLNETLGEEQENWDSFLFLLTESQQDRLFHLNSSERQMAYLMRKPKLSVEDLQDMKACDFPHIYK